MFVQFGDAGVNIRYGDGDVDFAGGWVFLIQQQGSLGVHEFAGGGGKAKMIHVPDNRCV